MIIEQGFDKCAISTEFRIVPKIEELLDNPK